MSAELPRSMARAAVGLATVGTALSLAGSWIPSFWGDEAASVLSASRPLGSLFTMLGHVDAVHGSYYLFLHLWTAVFGSSPFAVRFPSAVAVGFTVAAVVVLAARLSTPAIAVSAGLVCCVLPRMTYIGAEGRSFAFTSAIVSWLTVMLVHALATPVRARFWVGYAALLALGIYLFLYVGLVIVVHLVIVLSARAPRRMIAAWFLASAAAVLASVPLLVVAFSERDQIHYLSEDNQVSPQTIFVLLWFGNLGLAVVAWALIAVVVAAVMARHIRHTRPAWPFPARLPSLETVALSWLLIPSVILIGGQFFYAGFTGRYLAFCAPAAALLMAIAIARIGGARRWVSAVGVVVVAVLALPSYLEQRTVYAKNDSDWSVVSAFMATHAQQGDAVTFDETVRPSRRPRLGMHTYPDGFVKTTDVALKTPFTRSSTWYDRAYTIDEADARGRFAGVDRVWMIEWRDAGTVDDYGRTELAALGFTVTSEHGFHRSVVLEYERSR